MNASGEWAPDYTSKERALMTPIYTKYGGGGTNFLVDYVLDQIAAGVVRSPSFMSAPVQAGLGAQQQGVKA
jgi:hypothetical protein